ncbi:hypothetical protein ASB1_10810 [Helicobacter heilmannii]|nr:hypothetical protein ASB1_10810 [Helicobacter heilmannii]
MLFKAVSVEGLEHLPAGWGVKRLYDVAFQPKDRIRISHLTPKNYVGVDNLLQNGQGKREATFIPKGNAKTSGYAQNDILIGNIRPYLKKIWLADTEGGTNGDVVVLRVRNAGVVAPRFLYYVLRRDAFFDYMMRFIKGVKMPRGDKKAILNFTIPLPPLKEQHAIAAFLDDKTSKLDRLITKKSCLLQSLKAYKHALISEVATKGLAATPTKQSGLDWLGEIPTGWELAELKRLLDYEQPTKYLVKSDDYKHYKPHYKTPVLTAGKGFLLGYTNETEGIYPASKENPVIIFDDFTTTFHCVDFPFKVKSSAIKLLTPKRNLVSLKFTYYAMLSMDFKPRPRDHMRHWITKYSIFKIPLPPLPEQQRKTRKQGNSKS